MVPSPSHQARPHFADDHEDDHLVDKDDDEDDNLVDKDDDDDDDHLFDKDDGDDDDGNADLNLKETFKILQPLHLVVQITQRTLFHLIIVQHYPYLISY